MNLDAATASAATDDAPGDAASAAPATAASSSPAHAASPAHGPLLVELAVPPPPHDPREREVVSMVGEWEVRQFAATDVKLAYFTSRGFLHMQLWHPVHRISILTPSRLTGGRFEVWSAGGDRVAVARWASIGDLVPAVELPRAIEIAAIERWFVLRHEPAEIHLLRVWWSSLPRARREA